MVGFFRCLARHKGFNLKNLEKKTKSLLVDYLKTIPEEERDTFEGVMLKDLRLLTVFGFNAGSYLPGKVAIDRSSTPQTVKMVMMMIMMAMMWLRWRFL